MKKIYMSPELQLTYIACEQLIADSLGVDKEKDPVERDKGGWVKGSRSDSNVWDDDWSR